MKLTEFIAYYKTLPGLNSKLLHNLETGKISPEFLNTLENLVFVKCDHCKLRITDKSNINTNTTYCEACNTIIKIKEV